MDKIIKTNNENINSYIFLDYIKSFGFKEENYKKILELFSSPEDSIGQFLKKEKVFLLSDKVNIDSLLKMNMKGANGSVNVDLDKGIFIPKSIENDKILLRGKTLSQFNKVPYNVPSINEFDVIIGNGYIKNIEDTALLNIDKYIGCCMDIDNQKSKRIIEMYHKMWILLNAIDHNNYTFEKDTRDEKVMCLIRKK